MTRLDEAQVVERLTDVPKWAQHRDAIIREYEFEGFSDAITFVDRVAELAEVADHHPDIDIRWNKVTLTLSTHSEGGLTTKDFDLAQAIDAQP